MSTHVLPSLHDVFPGRLWGGFRCVCAVAVMKYNFKYVTEIKLIIHNTSYLKKNYQISFEGRDLGVYGISKIFPFFCRGFV